MSSPRKLIVMRHAKAEPFAASDHDRVLLERGVTDAAAAGRWAAGADYRPDYVVVSSAARTQGTWTAFAAQLPGPVEAVTDSSLYSAGADAALEILHSVPDDAGTVMLVGHNPTMELLVHLLDDGGADPTVYAQVSAGFPTSALSVLDVPCAWEALDAGAARIRAFHVGRG